MINESSEIKNWMLETHRIRVQDDWLEACIEWIKEEQQETNTDSNIENVRNLVFEQWLMSDLRELSSQCLPEGLSSQIKIELNGNFPLQIESIVDVGTSCYSQLQKVQGTENANVGLSADTTLQPAWEPKPSKMLYFKLTDGTNDIQAMEYKPFSSLNTQTILGTKILVYGSVICRRGVLLLKDDNTHVYGGEVDSLIENNPPEKILQKAL
ncbi:hypothetical protein LOTGIDRAFT_210388 [Lottia gigantea]|uniref:RecQ-mediated genome instability protein 1 n=1 Tax=Lottia gigantea TaxID=225164 RepID=V4A7W8_LOTGI|nr:hypothetical protein LOTGIDRAFT_210388 [Lottia gigantea]ESO89351.1 hypothetical protein LOTGIDRAFT_210388 [Lottia gigantea]